MWIFAKKTTFFSLIIACNQQTHFNFNTFVIIFCVFNVSESEMEFQQKFNIRRNVHRCLDMLITKRAEVRIKRERLTKTEIEYKNEMFNLQIQKNQIKLLEGWTTTRN